MPFWRLHLAAGRCLGKGAQIPPTCTTAAPGLPLLGLGFSLMTVVGHQALLGCGLRILMASPAIPHPRDGVGGCARVSCPAEAGRHPHLAAAEKVGGRHPARAGGCRGLDRRKDLPQHQRGEWIDRCCRHSYGVFQGGPVIGRRSESGREGLLGKGGARTPISLIH